MSLKDVMLSIYALIIIVCSVYLWMRVKKEKR